MILQRGNCLKLKKIFYFLNRYNNKSQSFYNDWLLFTMALILKDNAVLLKKTTIILLFFITIYILRSLIYE